MFRIELFVEDKKLAPFLQAVAGLVAQMTPPSPVINVEERPSKISAASNGTLPDMFYADLRRRKVKNFTTEESKTWLEKAGKSPLSYTYLIEGLKKNKRCKMTQRGRYEVL